MTEKMKSKQLQTLYTQWLKTDTSNYTHTAIIMADEQSCIPVQECS